MKKIKSYKLFESQSNIDSIKRKLSIIISSIKIIEKDIESKISKFDLKMDSIEFKLVDYKYRYLVGDINQYNNIEELLEDDGEYIMESLIGEDLSISNFEICVIVVGTHNNNKIGKYVNKKDEMEMEKFFKFLRNDDRYDSNGFSHIIYSYDLSKKSITTYFDLSEVFKKTHNVIKKINQ